MSHERDRWGERTIFRIENGAADKQGIELILRLKGDPRPIEPEEIKTFLENVVKELNGEPSGLHGYRKVAFGGSKVKKSAKTWTKTDEKLLKKYIDDMCRSLTVSGRTKLAQILQEIAREITLL
ncbi:hypothetical protein ACFL6I_00555 [candidate division KSB1 bacterium]